MTPVIKLFLRPQRSCSASVSLRNDDQFHSELGPLGAHLLWVSINPWEYQLRLPVFSLT